MDQSVDMTTVSSNIREHTTRFQPCGRCPIASKHKVFYRGGELPIKYLFVGEAPGPSETVTHMPFTGTAGMILNELLLDCEVSNFGITNVIACFPFSPEKPTRFRVPSKEEIRNCKDRLDDLTECVTPMYYIALGKVAKANPPTGITYSLELDHPSYIARRGGVGTIEYKRCRHKLLKFMQETNWGE